MTWRGRTGERPTRVLVVGLGSAGRRHARLLRQELPNVTLTALRHQRTDSDDPPTLVDRHVYSMEDALSTEPDAAVVANPASHHVDTALPLIRASVPLLVEKPIAARSEGARRLLDVARESGVPLMVGYNLRFHPLLRRARTLLEAGEIGNLWGTQAHAGEHLSNWRPGRDPRGTVSARSELGGGVVLELSHEIDYVQWLAGEVVNASGRTARLGDVTVDVEDTAEIVLEHRSGALSHVHLDMLQRPPRRTLSLLGTKGSLEVDLLRGTAEVHRLSGEVTPVEVDDGGGWEQTYRDQLRHFLAFAGDDQSPAVDGETALRVLEIAEAVREGSPFRPGDAT